MKNIFDFKNLKLPQELPDFYGGNDLHFKKKEKIQKLIKENDFEALILTKDESVRYATDFYTKGFRPFNEIEYMTIIPRGSEPVLGYSSASDTFRVRMRNVIKDYRKLPKINEWHKFIAMILSNFNISSGRIGIDFLPYQIYISLSKELPKVDFFDITKIWDNMLAVKLPEEIEIIKKNCEIVEIGLDAIHNALKIGATEIEVSAAAEYAMRMKNSEFLPFIFDVASGYNTSIFGRLASQKRLRYGELVIADIGAINKGYIAEFARTFIIGKPNNEQIKIYTTCYEALMETIRYIKPGITCNELDSISRDVINKRGFSKYQHIGNTGHQVGANLHGEPLVDRGVEDKLVPNMIINLEPRVIVYDRFDIGGVQLEDCVLVTEQGHELLSHFRYEDVLLGK